MTEKHNPTNLHKSRGGHHFHCHGCRQPFRHRPGADLYCSPKCEKKFTRERIRNVKVLIARGFLQVKGTANVFRKDGVAVTLEQVRKLGLKETIALHRSVVGG